MYDKLSDRINWILDNYKISQSDLARAMQVRPSSVTCWLNGQTKNLSAPTALKLSNYFYIPVEWITNGGEPSESWIRPMIGGKPYDPIFGDDVNHDRIYATVSLYKCPFGAGVETAVVSPEEQEPIPIPVTWEWFRERHIKPEKTCIIQVQGDSMEPLIYDHDYVLVNTLLGDFVSGKIYAFEINNTLRIKRLYFTLKGDLTIHSDNPAYPDEHFSKEDSDSYIKILGRVIYRFGACDL